MEGAKDNVRRDGGAVARAGAEPRRERVRAWRARGPVPTAWFGPHASVPCFLGMGRARAQAETDVKRR